MRGGGMKKIKNKKILWISPIFLVAVFLAVFSFLNFEMTEAADDDDIITVNLDVGSTISVTCTDTVTMNGITGTGQSSIDSSNRATCNVKTTNSGGYKLEWQASSATMASGGDTIAAYTPASADTPETWSVAAADSEWGGHLGSTSTTADTTTWGAADTYAGGKWLNVNNAAVFQVVQRTSETSSGGDDEYIYFGAEVGANKWQPDGTYTVNVTMTATTL